MHFGYQPALREALPEKNQYFGVSMKPAPPVVQPTTWKQLYAAAQRVQDLKPWEQLDDLDMVIVRDPATGETGHGVFMGNGGSLFGFCVYRGTAGIRMYQGLADGSFDGTSDDYITSEED